MQVFRKKHKNLSFLPETNKKLSPLKKWDGGKEDDPFEFFGIASRNWQFLGNFFGNMKDASEFSLKIPEMNCLQRFVTLNLQIFVTEIWNQSFLERHAFEVVINFQPPHLSQHQQCSKPWLVVLYTGLYYPLIWGL